MNITKKISPYNHSSNNNIKYIVIHDTGNFKDTAVANASYFNEGDRQSSAHYFIDDTSIYQIVEDYNASWHCGDGHGTYGIDNHNSIGIEMCNSGGYISDTTIKNTLELVKTLMKKYNVSIDRVVRHYDASRKICPANMSKNNWNLWNDFKNKLTNVKEDKKVKSIVIYGNDIDRRAAEYLADFLSCPTISNSRSFDYSTVENVYAVGNKKENYTSYLKVLLSGSDRYSTMQEVLNYIKTNTK